MRPFFFLALFLGACTLFSTSSYSASSESGDSAAASQYSDADYDRLDGHGKSGKKVNVIEWEGNLEIHVYPVGSLRGLGLKLDKKDDKSVMVISYRFDNTDKPLIRRAILGIPFTEGFKAYRDTSATDYDKIIISNQGLSDQVALFKLDPPPTQLYPDGHPANTVASKNDGKEERSPAKVKSAPKNVDSDSDSDPAADDNGTIRPFFMNREPPTRR